MKVYMTGTTKFIDKCIFPIDQIPDDHYQNLLELGSHLELYKVLIIGDAHINKNPELEALRGFTTLHKDFGVRQGILKYKVVNDFLDTISKNVKIGTISFLHFPPAATIDKHKDPVIRETIFIIPLMPTHDYPPCMFYDEEGNSHMMRTIMPHFINSQMTHSMENYTSFDRVNFQLGLKHSFEEVKYMIQEGKFFA